MSKIFKVFPQTIFKTSRFLLHRNLSEDTTKCSTFAFEEIRIPVPWGHIAGKFWGNKDKPAVIAIHGWQDNANSFDSLIPLLNVPNVLAIDLPGHGFSSHFPEGNNYNFEEFVMLISRITKYYNLNKIGLLTHSLGSAIGYTYAAIFPNQINWLISIECARTLLTMHRYNTRQTYSSGIDMSIEIENKKKYSKIPAYKLSRMILMSIKGSLGSVYSPTAAMILLQRGAKEANNLSTVKIEGEVAADSDLKAILEVEMKMVKALLAEDKEKFNLMAIDLKKSLNEAEKNVKMYFSDKNDDKYYVFLRDPLIKIQGFQSFNSDLVIEASKNIKCPVLSLKAKNGFLHGGARKLYEKSLEILKTSSSNSEYYEVEGTHHTHLNTPESVAPFINNFIRKLYGSIDQRPLLCLHGWQDNANSYDNLIPLLLPELSYLAIDLPGHGFSSHFPPGLQYKSTDGVGALRRIQRYFNWPKISLMGHSFGAQLSFLFSSFFSKDVDFFIALEAFKPLSFNPSKYFKVLSKNTEKFLHYESFLNESSPLYSKEDLTKRWISATNNSLTEKSCHTLMERGATNVEGRFRLSRDNRLKVNTEIYFTRQENLKLAESITCDVLYIKAKDCDYFEEKKNVLEAVEATKKSARSFEYHELPGTHHFHMNNPEDLAPVINAFLKRVK